MRKNKEIIKLAKEILSETETRSGSVEGLVFKAYRLAKLVNNELMLVWLSLEKFGYSDKEPDITYMKETGRTFNEQTRIGYWGSISSQEVAIEESLAKIEIIKNFKPSGTYANIQFSGQLQQVKNLYGMISFYKGICSKVVSNIQEFATNVYYAYKFEQKAGSILDEENKKATDKILKRFPDLNKYFEVIDKNIASSNPRDWAAIASQCRSIFVNLSGELWKVGKKEYKCKDKEIIKTNGEKNKLIAYIDTKIGSSRTERAKAVRLFKTIHEIFTIGGKSKKGITRNELSTIVTHTFIVLSDLSTSTDLEPVK